VPVFLPLLLVVVSIALNIVHLAFLQILFAFFHHLPSHPVDLSNKETNFQAQPL
jgi:hypothetical protein